MKPNFNSDPTAQFSASPQQAAVQPTSPTVPLSVYRELAAELQASKAMLDMVHAQNQQLEQHNHLLRQEADRVAQGALRLRQLIEVQAGGTTPMESQSRENQARENQARDRQPKTASPTPSRQEAASAAVLAARLRSESGFLSDELLSETGMPIHPTTATSKPDRDFSGLWLALTVLLIIVTAFGAGFLIVRPLLPTGK